MSDKPSHNLGGLAIDLVRRIDEACRRFEADWRTGRRPRVEDYLVDVSDDGRSALLAELDALGRELASSAATIAHPGADSPTLRPPPMPPLAMVADAPTIAPAMAVTPSPADAATTDVHGEPTLPPRDEATVDHAPARSEQPDTDPPIRVRYFGDYELIHEIARGGMGVVFRARQIRLNRTVALKMILAGQLANDTEVRRFYTEAEAAANLDHPGIVPIFEVGQHEGQHYFSMGFVEGQSLSQRLAEGPLPAREAAELIGRVSEAIEYAHRQGVIHRDLKPANILLDRDGSPRVTDFGLAKRIQGDSGLTGSGQIMGTPSYMPPEQAGGNRGEVGPAADVYALGATLYALVTGRPPFQAATPMDTVFQVISDEPVPPRRLIATLPRDLETICLKCLEKDPGKRYTSAAALGEDLRRYLAGEPIVARPVGPAERAVKWVRRRPVIAALSALSVGTAIVGLSGIVWQWRQAVAARNDAQTQAGIARKQEGAARREAEFANRRLYDVQMNLVQRAWEDWFPSVFRGILDEQRPEPQKGVDRRGFEWFYWRRKVASGHRVFKQPRATTVRLPSSPGGPPIVGAGFVTGIARVVFSPDGARLAAAAFDGTVTVWDAATGRETLTFRAGASMGLTFGPDGRRLAIGGADGTVTVWDAATGRQSCTIKAHAGMPTGLTFSPDGARLASIGLDGSVAVSDVSTGRTAHVVAGHPGEARAVVLSPDFSRLAAVGADETVTVRGLDTKREPIAVKGLPGKVNSLAFSPDGLRLVGAGEGQMARVWDVATGRETLALEGTTGPVNNLAFSANGARIAAAMQGGEVKLWDAATGRAVLTLRAHTGWVSDVSFNADGSRLATAGFADGSVKIWDLPAGQETVTLKGHAGGVTGVAFSPDGTRIASVSALPPEPSMRFNPDGTPKISAASLLGKPGDLKVWDASTGRATVSARGHTGEITAVAFSPDGARIASADGDATILLWDAATLEKRLAIKGHSGEITGVAFSPDGARIASAGADGTVMVWDASTGGETLTIRGPADWATGVAFSPDGHRLACAGVVLRMKVLPMTGNNRTVFFKGLLTSPASNPAFSVISRLIQGSIRICDARSGQELLAITTEDPVVCVAFSPDGSRLASSGLDGTVKMWDAATGREALALHGHTDVVKAVSFGPDGHRLASASADKSVALWDTTTGQETLTLKGHAGPVTSVAFSADGHRLASASADGTIKVWDARPLDEDRLKPDLSR